MLKEKAISETELRDLSYDPHGFTLNFLLSSQVPGDAIGELQNSALGPFSNVNFSQRRTHFEFLVSQKWVLLEALGLEYFNYFLVSLSRKFSRWLTALFSCLSGTLS